LPIIDAAVDRYLDELSAEDDPVLRELAEHGRAQSFPYIGPQVGRLLALLTQLTGARTVLELGSGCGYSALWFARALPPGGRVHLTDRSAERLARAREAFARAGLLDRAELHEGDALAVFARLPGPFDIVLADIDKGDYPRLPALVKPKLRAGGLLVVDNVLWRGEAAADAPPSAAGRAARELNRLLLADPDYETVILPIRDGVAVARKK
jgi:predicted O-methyltransferase YrrM